jgi:phosphotriesterase-related protein
MRKAGTLVTLTRRDALRLIGLGAGLGLTSIDDPSVVVEASQRAASPPPVPWPPNAVIRTILRDINPNAVQGKTLMHEHIGTGRTPAGGSGRPSDDPDWMVEELKAVAGHGVSCIVAAQTNMPRPETTEYLRRLAERTGLHIIPTGSYYMASAYPPDTASKSEDQLADELTRAATAGRFGAFGEIGVNPNESDMAPVEKKVFRSVGKAHVRTGLPIFTHNDYSTGPNVPMDMALRQLDQFESVGVRPQSVALGHLCCLDDPKAEIAQKAAKRGAFIAFDRLTRQQQWITDEQRLRMILAILDAGYADHLLFSSDYSGSVVSSVGEREFRSGPFNAHEGGPGWARSIVWFGPMLEQAGVKADTLHRITVENPRRFLAFVPKQA